MAHRHRALLVALGAFLVASGVASAQTSPAEGSRRFVVDTVVGTQDFFGEVFDWPTQVVLDPFVETRLTRGLSASIRPVLWRVNGEWETLLDQAAVRYEFRAGPRWRFEAGRFPSPIGYGLMENRANLNAGVIWCHRPYYMPLPSLGPDLPRVSLVSAVYPNGVNAAASTDHWDARLAVVDRAPVEFWHDETRGARSAHVIVGSGVTPVQGLRLGVGAASGALVRGLGSGQSRYQLVNVEGEYAFGHTKVSGEWTRDTFEVLSRTARAYGWTLQAQQAITPRLFLHSRVTAIEAAAALSAVERLTFRSIDTTVGYRLDREVTLRAAHTAIKRFAAGAAVDHQLGLSLMWARRWW